MRLNCLLLELADAANATLRADTLWERWSSALRLLSSEAKHDPTTLIACNADGTVRHIARLIVAAYPTTDSNLPKDILDQIKKLR